MMEQGRREQAATPNACSSEIGMAPKWARSAHSRLTPWLASNSAAEGSISPRKQFLFLASQKHPARIKYFALWGLFGPERVIYQEISLGARTAPLMLERKVSAVLQKLKLHLREYGQSAVQPASPLFLFPHPCMYHPRPHHLVSE